MRPDDREVFLSAPRVAVLSTVDSKGRAHAVPVWFLWHSGKFSVVTDRGSQKHRNAERTGRAALTVVDGARYITAEGPVTVRDPITIEERLQLHVHYRGGEAARKVVDRKSTRLNSSH